MTNDKTSIPVRYGIALGVSCIALLFQLWLSEFVGTRIPFLLFIPSVALVAVHLGRGPAFVVLAAGIAFGVYILPPTRVFSVQPFPDQLALLAYIVVGALLAYIGGNIRRLLRRAIEAEQALLAEQGRQEQEEISRVRQMFEQAPGFMCILRGPDHVFEFENLAHAALHGHRDVLGRTVREAFPEVTSQGFHDDLDRVYRTGMPYRAFGVPLSLHRRPGGPLEQVFVDFVFQPILDREGKVSGIFVEGFDVTEKKQVQEALQLSQERLKEGLAAGRMAIWDWDPERDVVEVSENGAEIFGADLAVLQQPRNILHPEDAGLVKHAREEAMRNKSSYSVTARFIRPDNGEVGWVELRGQVKCDEDGKVRKLSGIALDVTQHRRAQEIMKEGERRRQEAELRAAEAGEKLALAVDAAQLGTFYCPMPLGKIYWNATCKSHFFLPEDAEIDFELFYSLIHPDDRERTRAAVEKAVFNRQDYDIEYRTLAPDGRVRWIRAKGRSYYAPDGTPTRFDGITIDISRQKHAEEQLLRANRQKDDFLAMLAHELRNPLAPVSAAASLLMLPNADAERIARTSEIIARQVKHMSSLLEDLLDVSRVTRGVVDLKKEMIDMKPVISAALEQVNPLIETRRHRLVVQLAAEPVFVVGDEKRLIQVIANILTNAAKYTPSDGRIEVTLAAKGACAVITIKDNGIGMDCELLGRVFELFVQGERSPDRQQGGLGLGLALVRSLVELHGGDVSAHSEGTGKGSVFNVTLPRQQTLQRHDAVSHGSADVMRGSRQRHIMVVDDNVDAANTMAMFFDAIGYAVTAQDDPQRALELSRSIVPDVCIIDIGMPVMDGYQLARRLRSQPETQKALLIAVSGYGQEQDKQRAFEAGFDHHLVKPIEMERILVLMQGD